MKKLPSGLHESHQAKVNTSLSSMNIQ